MKIERISWDEETVDHISNHSVSPEEVEEVLFNGMDSPLIMRGKEGRYLAYGKTNGARLLLVVWASKYRKTKIITARDMSKKEKKMKVPKFKNLKEEREFWDTHESTDYLDDFETAKDVVFVRPKKEVISLRLDPKIVRKLKELADKEGLPPTTYARMLIVKGIRERAV